MTYVIACGDEGVQLNGGVRLGVVGSGYHVDGFSQVVAGLKKVLSAELCLVASEENDWMKQQLDLTNWEQVNASAQQQLQAVADKEGVQYAGFLPFADPQQLEHGVRGHMVRPHGIHIANKICFTLAGGEQKFNLGCYVISAEWVREVEPSVAKKFLQTQIDFYTKLSGGNKLAYVFEETGELGAEVAAQNKETLEKILA